MDRFVGRKRELALLRELRTQARSALAVIYGRRRVGKSSLMLNAFKDEKLLLFEGLENRPKKEQIKNFLYQLVEQIPVAKEKSQKVNDWHQALKLLYEHCENGVVVVFDEFQWIANYRSELVAELKVAWDRDFSNVSGLTMVLCGSVASFMLKKVVRSKALYGRSELVIHLQPFKIQETQKLLDGRGVSEVLLAHLLVGGIPQYLHLLNSKPSITIGIQELAFEEHGYFVDEYSRIFTSHFGKSDVFTRIVQALSKRERGLTRAQIAELCFKSLGGKFTKDLYDLETAGIITSYLPFHRSSKSREKIYRLSDPYLRFYLSFIEPSLSSIKQGSEGIFIGLCKSPSFLSWCGIAFELFCLQHSRELAKLMGFSDVDYKVGPYFQNLNKTTKAKGVQIDLVFDRKDDVIVVCEIKYRNDSIGIEIVSEVERKINLVPNKKRKTLRAALITKSNPTSKLTEQGFFSYIIPIDKFLAE